MSEQSASPGPSHVMLMEEGIDCTIDLTEREDKVRVPIGLTLLASIDQKPRTDQKCC